MQLCLCKRLSKHSKICCQKSPNWKRQKKIGWNDPYVSTAAISQGLANMPEVGLTQSFKHERRAHSKNVTTWANGFPIKSPDYYAKQKKRKKNGDHSCDVDTEL